MQEVVLDELQITAEIKQQKASSQFETWNFKFFQYTDLTI